MKMLRSLLLISALAFAKEPDWVTNQGKSTKYPEAFYLTGFGIATAQNGISKEQAAQFAINNARKNLIEKIRLNIQTVTSSKTEEVGDKYSSFFNSAVQSTSTLDIQGLETEQYSDDDIAYAFVRVKRDVLQQTYQQKVNALKKEIDENLKLAAAMEQESKKTQALSGYLSCYPLLRELEETQSILTFVKVSNSLNELQQTASSNDITIGQIHEAIAKLVQRPLNTTDDLAWFLVYQLKEQAQQKEVEKLQILVVPLLYQDTKMGSSFSRYFNQIIEQKLPEVARWDVVQQAGAPYVLSGSYWEQKNIIKFIINIRSVKDGRIIASAEASVPLNVIASSGRSLTPENIKAALVDQKVFASGELSGGGLTVEAWTNKQTTGNLYTEGERMTVTVRVNMPSYIRFLYHMADGKRVLLLDNYFLDQTKVNLAYEIPQEFECSAPFGSEVLQIFARTNQFESVQTLHVDGYDYIQEDLKSFVVTTRGMKAAQPKTMQGETRITITTMKE